MGHFGGYDDRPFLAELYDHVPMYFERPDREFFVSYSRKAAGKTLELGCGTGRVLIPTAEAGCAIVGLDLSEFMLARCREKLKRLPGSVRDRVTLVQSSMTDFDLPETFDLVTIPFRPFQHLVSVQDQLACLRCINRHLSGGGRLILDLLQVNFSFLLNPDSFIETENFSGAELPGGRTLRRTHRLVHTHRAEQYNDVELIHYVTHPDGTEERLVQAFPFRYFFRYEIEHLLARCGFEVQDVFGNYDKSPLIDDSPEMIFVAVKVGQAT